MINLSFTIKITITHFQGKYIHDHITRKYFQTIHLNLLFFLQQWVHYICTLTGKKINFLLKIVYLKNEPPFYFFPITAFFLQYDIRLYAVIKDILTLVFSLFIVGFCGRARPELSRKRCNTLANALSIVGENEGL